MCMFCRSLFVLLYFFCRTLCCIFFFDIRILFTPLISSNSTYICEGRYLTHMWKHLHDHIIQQVWVHNTSLTLPHLIEVAVPTRGEWTVMHVRVVRIGLSPFLRVSHWILKLFWWCCIDLFFIFLGKISVLVVLLYFFFRTLCCIFFFDIRILFTPLVSSNSPYICEGRYLNNMWKHLHDHMIQQVRRFRSIKLV